jgi:two-component system response regulator FixJ
MPTSPAKTMICVVDDDCDVLGSLQFLLETDGFDVRTFKSGAALRPRPSASATSCANRCSTTA